MATERRWLKKAFRIAGLPHNISNCQDAADFIAHCLRKDGNTTGVKVYSVATTLDYWEVPHSKVATAQFDETVWPSSKARFVSDDQWKADDIRLDTHFLGMTPLNDVESSKHRFDCFAISGLASHPFGSWQPHGEDRSFMWIRDELPMAVPGVRAILYGYGSKLYKSNSSQTPHDIAIMFAEQIRACYPGLPPQPLIFLAHSLGGIVLKDAVMELARIPNFGDEMLEEIRGIIMFGAPNIGMEQSHLAAIVKGQPNETLVQDLSPNSPYLERLNESFSGVIQRRKNLKLIQVYETLNSPITELKDGALVKSERTASLVNHVSATGLPINEAEDIRISVNENHSDMVKYYKGHPAFKVILQRLRDICSVPKMQQTHLPHKMVTSDPGSTKRYLSRLPEQKRRKAKERILQELLELLDAPLLDSRRAGIDSAFESTFEWVFDLSHFIQWLKDGTGIFWINGKPGSGKSTLMKYIFEHKKTQQLVLNFRSGIKQIFAGFFFHFRGTALQKSFEGLLRSLLKQILEEEPSLVDELLSLVIVDGSLERTGYLTAERQWTISNLKEGLQRIISQNRMMLDLILFFDALDEFDGHMVAICQFLQDLVKPLDNSKTRVRICFSSRPWKIFENQFNDCPKITIQDHTQDDIRYYYLGMLSDSEQSLAEMAPEVVQRASGVFLWVQLLIRELKAPMATEQPSEEIRERFLSFPKGLDQFYKLTIDRIPTQYRWKTFVLLEAMIRAVEDDERALRPLYYTVLVSECRTSTEARKKVEIAKAECNDEEMWKSLLLWSGGLVEKEETGDRVKMMHQTVYDFAGSLRFKELALGPIARITHDNGYTFLAKHWWTCGDTQEKDLKHLAFYAQRAESVTGRSNMNFYQSDFLLDRKKGQLIGTEGFLLYADLIICLQELVQLDSSFLKNPRQPFLFLLFMGVITFEKIKIEDIKTMAELLQDHGYSMKRDIPAILACIGRVPYPNFFLTRPIRKIRCRLFLDEVGSMVFSGGKDLEKDLAFLDNMFTVPRVFRPLHYSSPAITEAPLQLGSKPDVLDSENLSPLDLVLQKQLAREDDSIIQEKFKKCSILLHAGSEALSISEREVQEKLDEFDRKGCDTTFLRERLSHILENRRTKSSSESLIRKVKRLKDMPKNMVTIWNLRKELTELAYFNYLGLMH